jgi:hypothetical protein
MCNTEFIEDPTSSSNELSTWITCVTFITTHPNACGSPQHISFVAVSGSNTKASVTIESLMAPKKQPAKRDKCAAGVVGPKSANAEESSDPIFPCPLLEEEGAPATSRSSDKAGFPKPPPKKAKCAGGLVAPLSAPVAAAQDTLLLGLASAMPPVPPKRRAREKGRVSQATAHSCSRRQTSDDHTAIGSQGSEGNQVNPNA